MVHPTTKDTKQTQCLVFVSGMRQFLCHKNTPLPSFSLILHTQFPNFHFNTTIRKKNRKIVGWTYVFLIKQYMKIGKIYQINVHSNGQGGILSLIRKSPFLTFIWWYMVFDNDRAERRDFSRFLVFILLFFFF